MSPEPTVLTAARGRAFNYIAPVDPAAEVAAPQSPIQSAAIDQPADSTMGVAVAPVSFPAGPIEWPREQQDEPMTVHGIPSKFLYVRPGYAFVPSLKTHRTNSRGPVNAPVAPVPVAEPIKDLGVWGKVKGLFAKTAAA